MPKSFTSSKGGGSGNVTGAASSVDNAIVRFDGTGGKTIQDYTSGAPTISDTGVLTMAKAIVGQVSSGTAPGDLALSQGGAFPAGFSFIAGGEIGVFYGGGRSGLFVAGGSYQMASSGQLAWSSGADPYTSGVDAGIERIAAKVIGVTDGSTGVGWIQTAGESRVTGNVTNATVTPANITGLSATVAAGRTYSGQIVLYFNQSTAADGFRFDLDGGTATATDVRITGTISDSTSTRFLGMNTALATDFTDTSTSGNAEVTINFTITVNAAGTIIPRFANEAASTGTGTVYRGSYMILTDIA